MRVTSGSSVLKLSNTFWNWGMTNTLTTATATIMAMITKLG